MPSNLMSNETMKLVKNQMDATLNFKDSVTRLKEAMENMLDAWIECENVGITPETECPFPFDQPLEVMITMVSFYEKEINDGIMLNN